MSKLGAFALTSALLAAACGNSQRAPATPSGSPSPAPTSTRSTSATPLHISSGVSGPILVSSSPPRFPVSAISRRVRSNVYLFEAIVNEAGTVSNVRTIKKADITPEWPELEEACRQSVLSWRYEPAEYHGKPVPVSLTVSVLVDFQ